MRKPRRWWAALPVLAIAAGCGDPEGAGPTGAAGSLGGPDVPLGWEADSVARVGGATAPAWAAFQEVTALAFDGQGRLHILDGPQRRLVVVDSAGRFVETVGTAGEGPGEFRFPARLAVAGDGALWIHDAGHGALLAFDAASRGFRAQYPLDEHGWVPAGPLHVAGSRVVFAARRRGSAALDASRAGADGAEPRDERAVVAFLPPDSVAPVYRGWAPPVPLGRPLTEQETGGFRVRLPPVVGFSPELHTGLLPDGRLVVADSTTWTVRIVDPAAAPDPVATATVLARPGRPTPVTGGIRDAERARRTAVLEGDPPRMVVSDGDGGSATVTNDAVLGLERARIDAMGFHEVIPVIHDMAVDPAGRIWVQRHPGEPGEPGPVDLVTADGRYLGTLPPDGPSIPAAFGPDGLLATVTADDLGAPVIHILRLADLPAASSPAPRIPR